MKMPSRKDYPKKLWLGGSQYKIRFVAFKDPDICGICDANKKIISINKNLSPILTLQTLIHEILHALLQFEGKKIVSHKQIYKMEDRFAQLLMDNYFTG